jgi:hypothetical protein
VISPGVAVMPQAMWGEWRGDTVGGLVPLDGNDSGENLK